MQNPMMTFPITKRIDTKLLIGRMTVFYIQKGVTELSGKIEEWENVGAETNKR